MNKERIQKVAENMRAEGLEQILVTAPTSVFYLTGKWIAPGERMLALLVRGDGSSRLFANRLFALKGAVDAHQKKKEQEKKEKEAKEKAEKETAAEDKKEA